MASTGVCLFPARLPSVIRQELTSSSSSSSGKSKFNPISTPSRRPAALSTDHTPTILTTVNIGNGRSSEKEAHTTTTTSAAEKKSREVEEQELNEEEQGLSLKDYFEQVKDFVSSDGGGGGGGGPPCWFSPLGGGSRLDNSPLLLFLPGIDGTGLGLIRHHQKLGKIFDVWCLHIPAEDRTPFADLVKLVERTVRSEHRLAPNRPIYLVGESLGACLALSVAALNPDIDLVLILANPATSFSKSQLQPLVPLLQVIPDSLPLSLPHVLSSMTGFLMGNLETGLGLLLPPTVEKLSRDLLASASYLSAVVADILPRETLLWKLQMIRSASIYANSRLHAVKAQTLILSSGMDQLLPSQEEGERLKRTLAKCEIRVFANSGHFLFLEDHFDLVTVIKATCVYRRSSTRDFVTDYIPPAPSEVKNIIESNRLLTMVTSPVMFSTLADGKIVRGLAGIPSEGPVLFVGYHMLLGLELAPMVTQMLEERNIQMRGIAHPMMFTKLREGRFPDLSVFDTIRLMGAVPVSGANIYKLLSTKSHVLLYPGGVREALHRKGEEYKLFWPEQSEFVRMAARFGAKIVPFGAVGEDDIGELFLDYDDQMRIPSLKEYIQDLTDEVAKVRIGVGGEVGKQDVHLPLVIPKLPGRFYYYFGKPIETQGRKQELRDKEKAHQLYLQVKSEVEKCLAYLREKREKDPYRALLSRIQYQATHGFTSEIPTFDT